MSHGAPSMQSVRDREERQDQERRNWEENHNEKIQNKYRPDISNVVAILREFTSANTAGDESGRLPRVPTIRRGDEQGIQEDSE